MAVNIDDYVNSDAKVKAARAALASAKERVTKLTGVKLPGAKESLAKAKSDVTTAESKYNTAVQNAKNYFNANKEQIIAAEEKKQAGEKAKGEETAKRIEESGLLSEAQLEAIRNAGKKPPQTQVGTGVTGAAGTEDTINLINQANSKLAALAAVKEATNFISNKMNSNDRLLLAKSLKAAGYDVIETGEYNRGLVEAYQNVLADAQAENTFNKEISGFKPYDFTGYLAYRTGLVNAAKGAETKTSIDITNLTDVDAAAYIETAFNNELKRKPTTQEIKALSPAVKAYVRSSATKTISSDGKIVRTSGPNPIDWLTQAIRGQQQVVGLNTKDKKQAAQAKAATKVLGKLSEELTTKQGQALGNFNQKIIDTVQSNGLSKVVGQSQIDAWAKRLQNGENEDAIKREIRNIAKIGMPDNIKSLMDAGNDLDTIYAPYKKVMATTLEINPETISLDDSVLRSAIGPTGEMSIYDFQRQLRKDSRWERTDNARKEVSDNLLRVIKDFGYQG